MMFFFFDKKKKRLSQVMYRMLLFDEETVPKVPPEVKEQNFNCASPYALDVIYKTVYSAPWS